MIRRLVLGAYAPAAALGLLFCLLGLVLGLVVFLLPDPNAISRQTAVAASENSADAVIADFDFPSLTDFSEMVERPIFSEGRRYQADQQGEDEETPVVQTPLNFKLMGLIFSPDGQIALFRTQSGKYRRIHQGDTINDWTLEALMPDRVTLSQGDETRELLLLKKKKKTAPPPEEGSIEAQMQEAMPEGEGMNGDEAPSEDTEGQENGEEVSSDTSDAEQSTEMQEGEAGDESAIPSESLE